MAVHGSLVQALLISWHVWRPRTTDCDNHTHNSANVIPHEVMVAAPHVAKGQYALLGVI
jgi:hypothetical protein